MPIPYSKRWNVCSKKRRKNRRTSIICSKGTSPLLQNVPRNIHITISPAGWNQKSVVVFFPPQFLRTFLFLPFYEGICGCCFPLTFLLKNKNTNTAANIVTYNQQQLVSSRVGGLDKILQECTKFFLDGRRPSTVPPYWWEMPPTLSRKKQNRTRQATSALVDLSHDTVTTTIPPLMTMFYYCILCFNTLCLLFWEQEFRELCLFSDFFLEMPAICMLTVEFDW